MDVIVIWRLFDIPCLRNLKAIKVKENYLVMLQTNSLIIIRTYILCLKEELSNED